LSEVGSIEHRKQIVHLLIQRRSALDGVRGAGPTPVKHQAPRKPAKALIPIRDQRVLPEDLDMGDQWASHHKVHGTLPPHLIGDAQLATTGVPNARRLHLAEG
jgi:hypothetical protein